jgi:hypothetical protein
MKNRRIIFLALIIFSNSLYGQKNDDNWRIEEAGTTSPSFDDISYYKNQVLPFSNIIVLDKRFDSSKAGYANVLGGRSKYTRIVPKNPWSGILNNYFKRNLDSLSSQSLVIIIRSFWIQRGVIDELTSKKIVTKAAFGNTDFGGNCKTAIDVYVQTDTSLQALFQVDTSFLSLISNLKKNRIEDFFFLPFDSVARRIATLNLDQVLSKKRKLTWAEVNNYYSNRFNLPILAAQSINKGIFLTFSDFKNNKPYVATFKFREGKLTDELYITDNGREDLIADYWGFCDDKGSLYIKSGFNAFKAIRQQNTFELFGAKYISNYHNNPSQGSIKISSYSLDEKILQVNMDNGKIY